MRAVRDSCGSRESIDPVDRTSASPYERPCRLQCGFTISGMFSFRVIYLLLFVNVDSPPMRGLSWRHTQKGKFVFQCLLTLMRFVRLTGSREEGKRHTGWAWRSRSERARSLRKLLKSLEVLPGVFGQPLALPAGKGGEQSSCVAY
jgi:hypothetical protein